MDKYSVLMSLYIKEKPEYLELSIESMINQTIMPDEIVIVKDGPITNELEAVLDKYLLKYPNMIKIVVSKTNVGLGMALNLGLKHCKNELVARMDTDDISLPFRCEKQLLSFMKDSELVIVGTMIDEFNNNPDVIVSSRVVPTLHDDIYEFSKKRSAFNHPTVMYKKSKILSCGGYSNMKRNQDIDLFGRMLFKGHKATNVDESLLLFRSNPSLSKRRKSWQNTKSYIQTVYGFWKMGYSSLTDLLVVSIGQTIIFLSPTIIQDIIYKKILR